MFYSAEQAKRIQAEQEIMRSGETIDVSLCQYKNVSCVRCCLPHIGGDSHIEDSEGKEAALFNRGNFAHHLKYSSRYLGPGNIVMKFNNFNPLKDPRIEASQYEDSFPDVGREEMEKRFSERRNLFLDIYDRERPRQSLPQYMKAVLRNEGYAYKPAASSGPVSLFLGGSVPAKRLQKGELPECQLLGFVNGERKVGCMAHPLAETSQGYDGRDQVGFFNHTDGCRSVGCEASKEFRFLSTSAMKTFDKAVEGISWYEYSRHATSVLVYYLRSYDHILRKLDERELLDTLTLEQLVKFTNTLFDEWPMRKPDWSLCRPYGERGIDVPPKNWDKPILKGTLVPELWRAGINGGESRSGTGLIKGEMPLIHNLHNHLSWDSTRMNSLDILTTDIPLAERMMYIALDTLFLRNHFDRQLQEARDHVERQIEALRNGL
jgi:hypothetical protein